MGNFTDASVFWDSFTTFSRYVPGAIVYTVKSIPDMLDDAARGPPDKMDERCAHGETGVQPLTLPDSLLFPYTSM